MVVLRAVIGVVCVHMIIFGRRYSDRGRRFNGLVNRVSLAGAIHNGKGA